MRITVIKFSIAILFMCVMNSTAQDTLSYDRVLNEALSKNLYIKNELLNVGIAKGEYYKTNNFFPKFPEIDAEYETDKYFTNNGNKLFSLILTQEFEIAGQFSRRNDISHYRIKQSESEYKTREYGIAYIIKSLLNDVISVQMKMQVAADVYKINKELLNSSGRRLKAGDISELDYNLVSIETNNSLVSLNKAESEFKNEVSKLNIYVGDEPGKIFYIDVDTNFIQSVFTLDQLRNSAIENRAEIKAKQFEMLATNSEKSLYKSENIPNLKLAFGYSNGTTVIPGDDIIGAHSITKIQDIDKNLKFGVGFSVPLPFNGLFNYNQGEIQIAEVRTKVLSNEIEIIKKEINTEVINAYNNWAGSRKNMELLKQNNIIIDNTLDLLIRGYEKGEISLINYLNEKQKIYEMKLKYIEVFKDYKQSLIDIEKVTQTKITLE